MTPQGLIDAVEEPPPRSEAARRLRDRRRSGVFAGVLVGAALGVVDIAILVYCGHAAALPWSSRLLVFAVQLAFGLALGLAAAEVGLALRGRAFARGLADRLASPGLAAALAGLGLALAVTLDTRYGPITVRPETPRFVAYLGVTALAFVGLAGWWRARPPTPRTRRALWAVVGVGLLVDAIVVLFPFADRGKSWLVATGILAATVVLTWRVVEPWVRARVRPDARMVSARVTLPLLLGLLATALLVPGRGSHGVRAVLHGRTTILFPFLDDHDGVGVGLWRPIATLGDPVPPPRVATGSTPARARVRGVVLVMVDAMRPDFVGPNEEGISLTPRLDAFAAQGTSFSRAYTTTPGTREAVRSMLGGCFHTRIPEAEYTTNTLVTQLSDAGISTWAVLAHDCIASHFEAADRVIDEAFEANLPAGRNARTSRMQTERAVALLDELDPRAPFLLFVHYYDPHDHHVVAHDDVGLAPVRERYAAEIANTDAWIGTLIDAIDARGLDDVAVVVTSDHGDELWDHHGRGHLTRVYEESVRIWLAARLPGAPAGRVHDELVSIIALYPTLRELYGLPIPADLDARSLVPVLEGRPREPRPHVIVQSRGFDIVGVVRGDHKLIADYRTGALELYDLRADPHERINLADDPPIDLDPLLRLAAGSRTDAWLTEPCGPAPAP